MPCKLAHAVASLSVLSLVVAALPSACGGKTSALEPDAAPSPSVVPSDAAPASPLDAGDAIVGDASAGDCAARGGVCLPKGAAAPPDRRPAGPGEGACGGGDVCWVKATPASGRCATHPECNPDPTISALHGECFFGVCVCKAGFHVQPNGKCDKPPPPECAKQGGKCFQQPATCPAGNLSGTDDLNRTCGDFVEAVCCSPEAACKGPRKVDGGGGGVEVPVGFVCCAPNDALRPPACVNGWQTCPAGLTPVALPGGC